jgi:two-component system response regulator FixJ
MDDLATFENTSSSLAHGGAWERSANSMSLTAESDAVVHIVDNDEHMRKSLCWLIEPLNFHICGHALAKDFLAAFDARRAGCLVLDVRMPGMSGLDLQQELLRRESGIPIIFITAHADVAMCVRAMKRGAFEFFEKPFNQQALVERVQAAVRFDQERHARRIRGEIVAARLSLLSQREREVLNMIYEGASNRSIAAAMKITVRTVEAHRARVMEKMRADSIVSLVRMVCQSGC